MADEAAAPFECCVSASIFARAFSIAAKDNWRPNLAGVCVEPIEAGGVVMVATDGKRLIALHDTTGVANFRGVVLPSREIVRALSSKVKPAFLGRSATGGPSLIVRGNRAATMWGRDLETPPPYELLDAPTEMVTAFQWIAATVGTDYPEWRRVIGEPDVPTAPIGPLNPSLLSPLAAALATGLTHSVKLVAGKGGISAPIFVFTHGSSGVGVVMPMVDRDALPPLPAWATAS